MYQPIGIKSTTLAEVVSEINSELRNLQQAINRQDPLIIQVAYEQPKRYIENQIVRVPEGHAWGTNITPGLWMATGKGMWSEISLSSSRTPGA